MLDIKEIKFILLGMIWYGGFVKMLCFFFFLAWRLHPGPCSLYHLSYNPSPFVFILFLTQGTFASFPRSWDYKASATTPG
jgi:hypothetical protein